MFECAINLDGLSALKGCVLFISFNVWMLEFIQKPLKDVLTGVKLHFRPHEWIIENKRHCHSWDNDGCSVMSGQVALYSPLKDSLPWSDCSFRQRSKTQKDGVLRLCDYQQDDFFLSPTVFIGSGFTCGRGFNRYRKLIWQVSLHMGKYLPYCCIYDTSSVISKCQLITTRILGWC